MGGEVLRPLGACVPVRNAWAGGGWGGAIPLHAKQQQQVRAYAIFTLQLQVGSCADLHAGAAATFARILPGTPSRSSSSSSRFAMSG